jgi:hypothetical protein
MRVYRGCCGLDVHRKMIAARSQGHCPNAAKRLMRDEKDGAP